VQQTDRVRVGADDRDPPADPSGCPQLGEQAPRQFTLGDDRHRDADRHEQHPEPGEVFHLHGEGQEHHQPDADSRHPQDVGDLVDAGRIGTRAIEMIHRRPEGEPRETHRSEHEMVADTRP